ncbi:MAG: glycoside hydrolase family 95 protein, partial [Bacteroidota bacterium]
LSLWYDKPAADWNEALPVGNGRLGAMVYGGTASDTLQFNEETLWTGQPHDYAHEGAHEVLDELRELLWDGRQAQAQELAMERFMSKPLRQLSYQPFGKVLLTFPGHDSVSNYKRALDLKDALATVAYEVDGVRYYRETLASHSQQTIITNIQSSKKGQLNFSIQLTSQHADNEVRVEGNQLILSGKADNYASQRQRAGTMYPASQLTFESRLKVDLHGGIMTHQGARIKIEGADEATLSLVAATSFVNYQDISADPSKKCEAYIEGLEGQSFQELKKEHIADHQSLFDRVDLHLGTSEPSQRPTDQRLRSFARDEDPSLVALLFQYGRYLLIASSRPGTQPANLQGIWNDQLQPPWDSKYTININTEMNYWPAEITNLSELSEPLFGMLEDLSMTGRQVAREHYQLEGWVAHHNTDLWRGAAPINHANHGIWVTGGAWLAQHLWWHYEFTNDQDFLRNKAYPILKEASRFFASYLVSDPNRPDWLVSGPSNSPENGGLVMGPTMDHQILRALFSYTIEAADILNVDDGFAKMLAGKRDSIAPNQIGQYGQLQEWLVDKDDPENTHRHVSHLWGLHPGSEIHPMTTPELAEAARVTLSHRGDGGTGWSLAWKINFWARLLDGDHAFSLIRNLIKPAVNDPNDPRPTVRRPGGLYPNLFDAHPPFQIDGNFGATSGITEMLLQSHLRDEDGTYYQDLLPALPSGLPSGSVSGIVGRGGFEWSIAWEDGQLTQAEVVSRYGNSLKMRYKGKTIGRSTSSGERVVLGLGEFE